MSRSVCLLSFCVSRRPHLLRDLFTGRGTSFGYSKMVSSRRRGRVCRALVGFDTPGQRVAATAKTVSNIQLSRGTAATATARAARRCWPFCCIIHNSDPKLNNSSVPIIRRQLGSANGTKKTKGIAKQRRVCGNKKRRWAKVTRQRMRRLTGHYSIPFFCLCLLTPSWMFEEGSQKRKQARRRSGCSVCGGRSRLNYGKFRRRAALRRVHDVPSCHVTAMKMNQRRVVPSRRLSYATLVPGY